MIHFLHTWRVEKRAGNYEYRECEECGKRKIKVIDNLPGVFGGIIQEQWLEGKPLFTKDDRAVQYPYHPAVIKYMWSKNKGEAL